MPWQPEAMKDAVGGDKCPGEPVKHALIRGCPNGETHSIYRVSYTEYIGVRGERRGTETSKYPVGKEIKRDSLSSGERKGNSRD